MVDAIFGSSFGKESDQLREARRAECQQGGGGLAIPTVGVILLATAAGKHAQGFTCARCRRQRQSILTRHTCSSALDPVRPPRRTLLSPADRRCPRERRLGHCRAARLVGMRTPTRRGRRTGEGWSVAIEINAQEVARWHATELMNALGEVSTHVSVPDLPPGEHTASCRLLQDAVSELDDGPEHTISFLCATRHPHPLPHVIFGRLSCARPAHSHSVWGRAYGCWGGRGRMPRAMGFARWRMSLCGRPGWRALQSFTAS